MRTLVNCAILFVAVGLGLAAGILLRNNTERSAAVATRSTCPRGSCCLNVFKATQYGLTPPLLAAAAALRLFLTDMQQRHRLRYALELMATALLDNRQGEPVPHSRGDHNRAGSVSA